MINRCKNIVALLGFIILVVLVSHSCKREINTIVFSDEETMTLADFVRENEETYNYFWQIIEAGELVHTLSSYNPHGNGYTLFLPTDGAIEKYIDNSTTYSSFSDLLEDIGFVMELGRYHIVNTLLRSTDFPYGSLPDTTMNGELLTIAFEPGEDSITYMVNNVAPVSVSNIELVNGNIHVITELLEPVIYSSFDWLTNAGSFSILAEAFALTGLEDTMGIYKMDRGGRQIKNRYTVFAEPDTLFQRYGIESFDDLVEAYGTPGLELTDPGNGIYQFAAYHVIEEKWFLDEFQNARNYNTLASFPVSINAVGIDIRINIGVDTFGYEVSGTDTSVVNYLGFHYQQSNILTKNGAIHLVTEVMKPFIPNRSDQYFEFREEEEIKLAFDQKTSEEFKDDNDFIVLKWEGPDKIDYIYSESDAKVRRKDYIKIEGRFTVDYIIPKILPGRYKMIIRTNASSNNNATVQVFLDDQRRGGNLNLTTGAESGNPYHEFVVGGVEFTDNTEHKVTIVSLIPGIMIWDYVKFEPE